MLDRERARRLGEEALRVSPADETEFTYAETVEELNRFTADHPVQNLVRRLAHVAVRVRVGGREGKASTGTPTPEAVRRTVERAVAAAKLARAPGEELIPLPEPAEGYRFRGREALAPDPRGTAESVGAMTGACRAQGCTAAGAQGTESELRLVMNSRGVLACDVDTRASVSLTAFRDDGAGWSSVTAPDRGGIDPDAVASEAVGKALRSRAPRAVEPGSYTVVLEPPAVAALLLFAAYRGFGAQQVEEGSSFLAGRLGERIAAEEVTILDDALHPLSVGHTFDGEGMPRSRVELVEQGIARGVVHDRATARRSGCRTTGHALPQPNVVGPLPGNLVMQPGSADLAELLRDVDRGILVTQFHYTNMVEPTQLTLTGMTRNGTFLVERGEVGPAVRNLRFTQSLVEALKRVTGIGREQRLCSALFGGSTVVPAVRIDGFRFSSGTEF